MSKKLWLLTSLALIILIVAGGIWRSQARQGEPQPKEAIIIFYSQNCPHCATVDEYLAANNIAEQIPFQHLEVSSNQANALRLAQKAKICDLDTSAIGVPLLWDPATQTCLMGDQPIIGFFQNKLIQP